MNSKGVIFISLKEAIDTTTPKGKFMLTIFGAVAQLERDYLKDRQMEGIAIAEDDILKTIKKRKDDASLEQAKADAKADAAKKVTRYNQALQNKPTTFRFGKNDFY